MIKRTIEARLLHARLLARNVGANPRVKQRMEKFGYTAARMQELLDLIAQAETLKGEKANLYNEKKALAKQLEADVLALKALYKEHLTIARFVFRKDEYMQGALELKGTRKTDWAGWVAQVNKFYANAEAKALTALKKQGVQPEEIAQGKAMTEALQAVYQDKKSVWGNAQSATQQQDAVLKAINQWVRDFKKVAQVALQDDAQLLEVLGMVVPSVR